MPKPQKWVIVMSSEFYKVCDMIKKIGHIIDDPKESFPWYSICVCLDQLLFFLGFLTSGLMMLIQ